MKTQTNIEFVTSMMNFSNYGAMAQIFICDAIEKQAKKVAETPIEEVRKAFGENSLIHPDAWHGVACEIAAKCKERTL